MADALIQPQGYVRLNPDSRIAMASHAIALAGFDFNIPDGMPFGGYGQIGKGTTPEGLTLQFRKNGMRTVGPVVNVGTNPYVLFWRGRMTSDLGNNGYGDRDPSFVIGDTGAQSALVTRIGTGRGWSDSWGGLYQWDNTFVAAMDGLTPGDVHSLAVVRKANSFELWRDGVKMQVVGYGARDCGSTAMTIGSFVEESYWNCSNDTDMALRALIDPTDDEMRALFANPYSLFGAHDEEAEAEAPPATRNILVAGASTQSSTTSTGTIKQHHKLVGAALSQSSASSTAGVIEHHKLASSTTSQPSTTGTGPIKQHHKLAGASSAQASISSSAPIVQHHRLTGAASTQSSTTSTAALGAITSKLAGASTSQPSSVSTGAIGQRHKLASAPTAQASTSSSAPIVQHHHLAGAALTQSSATSTGGLGVRPTILAGAPTSQPATVTMGKVGQHHRLTAAGTAQAGSVSAGAIGQHHKLVAAPSAQGSTSPGGAVAIPADPRYARPTTDVTTGPWAASTGGTLAEEISEPTADSATFIQATAPGACEIALNPVTDPGTSSGQLVRYQVWSPSGNGITVRLKQGATVIAEWVHATLPLTPQIYAQELTAHQCDSITNYADLRFEFVAG